jgi:hypothetical protein
MEERRKEGKFADLVIQEIHTLGMNVAKLDRKLDLKIDKVYERFDDNKKCNSNDHMSINKKLDDHQQVHLDHVIEHSECREDCLLKADGKVSHSYFRWIVGGLAIAACAALVTIGGLTLKTQATLERHIYFAEYIYHEVTGQKWNDKDRESLWNAKEAFEKHMDKLKEGKIDHQKYINDLNSEEE